MAAGRDTHLLLDLYDARMRVLSDGARMSLRLFCRLCLGFYLDEEIGRIAGDDVSGPLTRGQHSGALSGP